MKSKKTKRALVSSALALVLCFVMLLGTTFAWFTDNASTSVNKVQAGTLDVALEMKEGEKWVSAEGKTLDFVKASGHESETVLWEPGATYKLPTVRIVNKGNLALKYQVAITAVNGDNSLAEVLYVTQTEVVKDEDGNQKNEYTTDSVTLKSLMTSAAGVITDTKTLLPNESTGELTISMTMDKDAGNTYQGKSIEGIAITVLATQAAVEYDSNGNTYDANAPIPSLWDGVTTTQVNASSDGKYHITNAAQLAWMMDDTNMATSNGTGTSSAYNTETFILDCDVDFNGATIGGFGSYNMQVGFTFDGNGHTISNFTINSQSEYYAGLFNQFNGTVRNLTVENATVTGKGMVGVISANGDSCAVIENCKVYDSTVIGVKKVGAVVGYIAGATVKNCYAENCTVICTGDKDDTGNDRWQSGEVIGYTNTGCDVSGNTCKNVTVLKGTLAEDAKAAVISGGTYTEYTTVSDAAKNAADGSTIKLLASISETLPVPSADNVTYTAAPGVVLSGGAGGSYWDKSTTFDGLTFKGGKGISVTAQQNVSYTIQNCTFDGVTATAWKQGVISVNTNGGTATVTVTGNTIRDVKNQTTDDGRIDTYGQQSDGIYINAASGNVTVSNNVIEDVDGTGIYVKTSGTVSITGNVVSEWGTGATSGKDGRAIRTDEGSSVTITGNKLLDASSSEEYIKATGATTLDVSGNYWGGKNPTDSGVFATDSGEDVKDVVKNYYSDSAMKTLVTCK